MLLLACAAHSPLFAQRYDGVETAVKKAPGIADRLGALSDQRKRELQPILDCLEELEARFVIARKRDDETDPSVGGGVGIAGERADSVHGSALVQAALMAMEQGGMGREELEHLGETARREPCIAADAGALLQMDGVRQGLRGDQS